MADLEWWIQRRAYWLTKADIALRFAAAYEELVAVPSPSHKGRG
jgi:hypothetical protein